MDVFIRDLRQAIRMCLKRPAFSLVAVVTAALGIGATTALFSVIHGVLLRPLPYPDPHRLLVIEEKMEASGQYGMHLSGPEYVDFRDRARTLDALGAISNSSVSLTGRGEPEELWAAVVSAGLFSSLGGEPLFGRYFAAEEDRPDADNVAILSYGLWQRRFGGAESVTGQTFHLDGESFTVVGVMRPDFEILHPDFVSNEIEIFLPVARDYQRLPRDRRFISSIARRRSGVTLDQVQADLDAVAARLMEEYPENYANRGWGMTVTPLHDHLVGGLRPALLVLFGAVSLILLLACSNVANLLLARAEARRKELSVRAALGAGKRQLVQQLLVESVLLAAVSGILGVVIAYWGLKLIVTVGPGNIPRLTSVGVDGTVLAFSVAVTLCTGILFGLVPALHGSRSDLSRALKETSRVSGADTTARRFRGALVVGEVCLSLILLVGTGLLLKSFARLLSTDPGYRIENVLTARLALPSTRYPESHQTVAFYTRLVEVLRDLPGIMDVGAVSRLPLSGFGFSGGVTVEGRLSDPNEGKFEAERRSITPGYFQAMGIPLLAGRDFDDRDHTEAPPVAIIDFGIAQRFWPDENPIGKRIKRGGPDNPRPWRTIVGVVQHVRHEGLSVEGRQQVYFPLPQQPSATMFLALRARLNPASIVSAARDEIWKLDPDLPVAGIHTMTELQSESVAWPRFQLLIFTLYGLCGLVLAAIGVYGLMTYTVSLRTHEMGLRLAMGAQRRDVLALVVGKALFTTLLGILLGAAGAFALSRLMSSLLFEVSPTDPVTFLAVSGLLLVVSGLASFLPALRAARVDPVVALRYE